MEKENKRGYGSASGRPRGLYTMINEGHPRKRDPKHIVHACPSNVAPGRPGNRRRMVERRGDIKQVRANGHNAGRLDSYGQKRSQCQRLL